jgi:hypothetical protein
MAIWRNGSSLPPVRLPALRTLPGIFRECLNLLIERMPNRNPKSITIHTGHELQEFRSMGGTALFDIILPLMNHFMRQRPHNFGIWLFL